MAAKKVRRQSSQPVIEAAARAAADLNDLGAQFALVGGVAAVSLGRTYLHPRRRALSARGYDLVTLIEQTRTPRLATARLHRRESQTVLVDLLLASSGVEGEIAASASMIDGIAVGRIGALLAVKVLSESDRRLQDRIDIKELAKIATDDDWQQAAALAKRIKERGFHRVVRSLPASADGGNRPDSRASPYSTRARGIRNRSANGVRELPA